MSEEHKNLANRDLIAEESRALEEADAKAVAAAREKKLLRKKKARRRKIIFFLILLLIAASVIGIWQYQKKKAKEAENAVLEVTAQEGETIVYGQITEIFGNEMTYEVLIKEEPGEMPSGKKDASAEAAYGKESKSSEDASGVSGAPSGDKPSGFPEGSDGERPSGFPGGSGADMPSDFPGGAGEETTPTSSGADAPSGFPSGGMSSSRERYTSTGESKQLQIPVGTDVITKLGSITTFSRLGTGDRIALIMDGEDLVKIYILS